MEGNSSSHEGINMFKKLQKKLLLAQKCQKFFNCLLFVVQKWGESCTDIVKSCAIIIIFL